MNEPPVPPTPASSPAAVPPPDPARLAAILVSLPDAVLCINRDWYITYANPQAIRISQLCPELFPTAPFWQLFPDTCDTQMEHRYRAAMASGQPDHFEFFYLRFDIWVDIHILPTDEGFAAVYRDITAERQAEVREAVVTRQVRQAFEAIPDGVVIIDSQWRFAFANQRALDLVGRSDILGHNIFDIFPGNNEEPFNSSYRTTMATRQPTHFEAFYGAPMNVWFKVQAKPYDDGIIIFFSDVSERKRAELREQETARRLAQVLEVTSDAIATLDREWRYTYLNTKAQKLIGSGQDLLGKNIWQQGLPCLPPQHGPRRTRHRRRLLLAIPPNVARRRVPAHCRRHRRLPP
jgi:PAS domain S-box-containing protein